MKIDLHKRLEMKLYTVEINDDIPCQIQGQSIHEALNKTNRLRLDDDDTITIKLQK